MCDVKGLVTWRRTWRTRWRQTACVLRCLRERTLSCRSQCVSWLELVTWQCQVVTAQRQYSCGTTTRNWTVLYSLIMSSFHSTQPVCFWPFYPHDALRSEGIWGYHTIRHWSYSYAIVLVSVCLSVCPFVTRWYCVEMAEPRVIGFWRQRSPKTLVFIDVKMLKKFKVITIRSDTKLKRYQEQV